MPQVAPEIETFARIKVIGVGGAGGAAINRMVEAGVEGVEFVAVNTDAQALHHSKAQTKIHIGKELTKGLGSGADPEIGQQAAEESIDEIKKAVEGADMVFITIGAGGGTGSGAGHIVAKAARDSGVLVVGFATIIGSMIPILPFFFLNVKASILASLILVAVVLFFVGALKARLSIGSWKKSGFELMVIGIIAALVGYGFGLLLKVVGIA